MSSKKAFKSAEPKNVAKVKNPGWHATSPAIVNIKKGVSVKTPVRHNINTSKHKCGGRKTTCVKQTLKKYTTRKSPPFPANKCKTKKRKGNDGKFYVSKPKGGTYKWVPFAGHTKTKKKK